MNYFKHYSFDLWLTLIKSNPGFKKARSKFFYENLNFEGKSLDDVTTTFRNVDIMCNSINEKTGRNIDSEEMYLMVISIITNYSYPLDGIDLVALTKEMDDMLLNHLPEIYSLSTLSVLNHLQQNGDCSLSILSNTGFVKGKTLRKVLSKLDIDRFFVFQLYSDEAGLSKPNKKFFELMFDNVVKIRSDDQINLNEVIHIGDNPIADISGAYSLGIQSLLINSNDRPILSLIN